MQQKAINFIAWTMSRLVADGGLPNVY